MLDGEPPRSRVPDEEAFDALEEEDGVERDEDDPDDLDVEERDPDARTVGLRRRLRRARRQLRRLRRFAVRRVPFIVLFHLLARIVPRRMDQLVVIPRNPASYDGNTKAWHVYVENHPGPERATLVANRRRAGELTQVGLNAVAHPTLRSVWVLLRAGHIFFEGTWWGNGFRGILSRGAVRWQLWHGNGIKAVSFDNPSVQMKAAGLKGAMKMLLFGGPDRVDVALFASRGQLEQRAEAFNALFNVVTGQTRDNFIVQPRSPLVGEEVGVDLIAMDRVRAARSAGSRVLLYTPTWRSRRQLGHWIALDWGRMGERLEELDAVLVVKAHAKDKHPISSSLAAHLGDRVIFVKPKSDLVPFLVEADVLVTDYSSVFADFLLLDRPVIFFRYDDETYTEHRALGDVEKLPGPVVTTNAQLVDMVGRVLATDPDSQRRRDFTRDFVELPDGRACERLMELVREWNAGRRPVA